MVPKSCNSLIYTSLFTWLFSLEWWWEHRTNDGSVITWFNWYRYCSFTIKCYSFITSVCFQWKYVLIIELFYLLDSVQSVKKCCNHQAALFLKLTEIYYLLKAIYLFQKLVDVVKNMFFKNVWFLMHIMKFAHSKLPIHHFLPPMWLFGLTNSEIIIIHFDILILICPFQCQTLIVIT